MCGVLHEATPEASPDGQTGRAAARPAATLTPRPSWGSNRPTADPAPAGPGHPGRLSTHLVRLRRPWQAQQPGRPRPGRLARPVTVLSHRGPGGGVVMVVASGAVAGPTLRKKNLMEAFLVSTGVVALGEMGDKTQLLALLLAARYRKPVPIILGILVATLANHGLAGWMGGWLANLLGPTWLRWVIGGGFLAMAVWMLVPDQLDDDLDSTPQRFGVFGTTVLTFFLAEMGDKTQIATVALAARYPDLLAVVTGTTFGMMLANVPAVLLGEQVARRVSMKLVHGVAAAIFALLGVLTLLGVGKLL